MLSFKRAIQDLAGNRFLHAVTVVTMAMSMLIISTFLLFYGNASDLISSWQEGIRIMAYLKADLPEEEIQVIRQNLLDMYGVQSAVFISKTEAFEILQKEMRRQSSLLENLSENPLPDAFEVRMIPSSQSWEKVELLAGQIEALPAVAEVEYGQRWLGRFSSIFKLFRVTVLAMGVLFGLASVFIVANTIRLVLYARRDEIEIMRLVGATDRFIKLPFYIEGVLQGCIAGILGVILLYLAFTAVSSNFEQDFTVSLLQIRFLPLKTISAVVLGSAMVGWLGCYLSLKQFLKA